MRNLLRNNFRRKQEKRSNEHRKNIKKKSLPDWNVTQFPFDVWRENSYFDHTGCLLATVIFQKMAKFWTFELIIVLKANAFKFGQESKKNGYKMFEDIWWFLGTDTLQDSDTFYVTYHAKVINFILINRYLYVNENLWGFCHDNE